MRFHRHAVAINQDTSLNSPVNSAARLRPDLLAHGQGTTVPVIIDGQSAPATPLWQPVLPVGVTIGEQAGDVAAALAPGFAGLLQVNVRIPSQIPASPAALTLSVGGVTHNAPATPYSGSQSVTITVK